LKIVVVGVVNILALALCMGVVFASVSATVGRLFVAEAVLVLVVQMGLPPVDVLIVMEIPLLVSDAQVLKLVLVR
jgi:hypothetical protein